MYIKIETGYTEYIDGAHKFHADGIALVDPSEVSFIRLPNDGCAHVEFQFKSNSCIHQTSIDGYRKLVKVMYQKNR